MEKRKNILLLKTASRYGSVDNYIDKIAAAMRELGCNTCVLDVWSLASPMRYNYVISAYKFDAVIDINSMLYKYGAPGNLPKDIIYGTYHCDPPKPMDDRIKIADDRTIIFSCDNDFRCYMEHFYPNVKHAEFMPLSGEAYPDFMPYKDRTIDIIFTGTYESSEKIKEGTLAQFEKGGDEARFCEDMFENIVMNSQNTLSDCLYEVLKKYCQSVSEEEFDKLMEKFMNVHWYARSYFREKLIHTLLEEGLEIHVYGNGWEKFLSPYKERLIIHEGGPYAARKALANAKIALNIMPWFKDGFQERIASAMLSKVVAVTDESKYINLNFEDGEELLIYSIKDIKALAGRIRYLLEHPEKASKIAESGYKKAQNHTWYNRIYGMLRKIEESFGVSYIQEGEGKQLEFEMGYPNQQTIFLDAIYELKKLADFIDNDMGKVEKLSHTDIEFLLHKFKHLKCQFAKYLDDMELNHQIWDYMHCHDDNILKFAIELFSMQCRAWMSKFLLYVSSLNSIIPRI